jgi:hypothetical protein
MKQFIVAPWLAVSLFLAACTSNLPGVGPVSPQGSTAPTASPGQVSGDAQQWVGTWYGTGSTLGQIEVRADGTYTSGGADGNWSASGNVITFKGPLEAWDGGRATLTDGNLEFYWTNPDGSKNYFSFAKY